MKFKSDGTLEPYLNWIYAISDCEVNKYNFPTGVGGILYPPHALYEEDVTNSELFLSLAPNADDVWFYAMAMRNGTLSKKAFTRNFNGEDYIELTGDVQRKTALVNSNWYGGNDKQIKCVFEKYNILELLQNEKV
jgi:hypothetical protein